VKERLAKLDAYQQRHPWLGFPLAVVKKFGDDQGGNLAALVAYFAFFSLFPLLLVFVTILGFVLDGDPSAQRSVEHSVTSQFPGIGHSLQLGALHGHTIVLIFGLVTSLLSGLGVTQAAQNAFDRVWAVPIKARPNFLQARLRGLGLLVSLGALFVCATLASGLVTGGLGGPLLTVAGIVLSLVLNVGLFLAAFRLMTASSIPTQSLWTGVIVAAVFWEILQIVGGVYIGHVEKHWTGTYASIGFVIALLVWLHLGSQMTLYAAEVNVVASRKLWPRSLFGPPSVRADEHTLEALAKVEERHDTEQIDVSFAQAPDPAAPPDTPSPSSDPATNFGMDP
jgi:YihY family inner membrane protein